MGITDCLHKCYAMKYGLFQFICEKSGLEALSQAITQVELDNKGVPILIKQYLKLGGRILGFNVDKGFSNALDALIMVDLVNTEPKVLQRYMGKAGLEAFRHYYEPPHRAHRNFHL